MNQHDGQGLCKCLALILAIILLLDYNPGHPAIILAIILVHPRFILPDYDIILHSRMIDTKKKRKRCFGIDFSLIITPGRMIDH